MALVVLNTKLDAMHDDFMSRVVETELELRSDASACHTRSIEPRIQLPKNTRMTQRCQVRGHISAHVH